MGGAGRLYQRGGNFAPFGKEGLPVCTKPLRRRVGRFSEQYVFSIMDSLATNLTDRIEIGKTDLDLESC